MLNANSKVKDLVANEEVANLLNKYMPGFTDNAQLKMAYGMSLKQIAGFAGLPGDKADALYKEIEALGIEG